MADLYHRYDRAAVADRITQPPFAQLEDRGRRRAYRTRAVGMVGAAMCAALVGTPLVTLPGGNQRDPVGASSPPVSERAWKSHDIVVEFLDIQHGLASYRGDACGEGWLSVTQDGGRMWSELREHPRLPGPDSQADGADTAGAPSCNWRVPRAIAPGTLVFPAAVPPSELAAQRSLISRDAGRTWQEYQPRVRTADSVPDGIRPRWPCDDRRCKEAGLGWYDARTGDWMVLRNQPVGVDYDGLTVAFDGSIWVYGLPSGGGFSLAVSRDRGRSWLDRSPREHIAWLRTAGFHAHDGDTAYLYPMRNTAEADPFFLYRTTDGGENWHPVPAAQRFEDVVFLWTNRDGGLLVADLDRDGYLSTDGGKTFAHTELPVWGGFEIGGGLQGWPVDPSAADPVDLYLSPDGMTWQPVQVPYYPVPGR
jgi:hypothetical protein